MSEDLSSALESLKIDRDAPAPPRRWPRWVLLVALLGAGGWAAVSIGVPYVKARFYKPEVSATRLELISPAQSSTTLTATGYVVPQRTSQVGTPTPGRVSQVLVKEGQRVKAGDVLVRLEAASQRGAVATARAKLLTARADADSARALLADAEARAARQRRLADKGIVAKAAAVDLEAKVKALQAKSRAAAAAVRAARAELKRLQVGLSLLTIKAPIAGTVVSKPVTPGQQVRGSLLKLADLTSSMFEAEIPEGRLHLIKVGSPCEIVLDAFPGRRYRCRVASISPRVDRAKATVGVKLRFVDTLEGVLPNMAGRASFLKRALAKKSMREPPRLVVPSSAVATRGGEQVVFVLQDGTARMRRVKLGEKYHGGYVVATGPPAGTRVIDKPPPTLEDGQQVKVRGN